MNDLLSLLLLIKNLATRIGKATTLIKKMREEGRETLTNEEWAELKADDDDARNDLLTAIEAAESAGS